MHGVATLAPILGLGTAGRYCATRANSVRASVPFSDFAHWFSSDSDSLISTLQVGTSSVRGTFTKCTMVLPFHLCSHVQNSFRARHKSICVPHTTQNLAILSVLLRTGFLQNVARGTTAQASPEQFHEVGDAQRRIWADLKYREDRPVLSSMSLISKPSKKIYMTSKEILRLCSGRRVQSQKPLRMGEIAVVRTDSKEHEWLEAREAVQLGLEGEVICRAM